MGRVKIDDARGDHLTSGVKAWIGRLVWEANSCRQFTSRRLGLLGVCSVLLLMAAMLAWWMWHQQQSTVRKLSVEFEEAKKSEMLNAARLTSLSGMRDQNGRDRLHAFEKTLLPHEDIPVLVQEVLQQAESLGLSVERGEYRPQIDSAGNFLRYGMSLPMKGDAAAINRFIQIALRTHKALILESIRFKRELIGAKDIEARVQWVVLARLPENVAGKAAPNAELGRSP